MMQRMMPNLQKHLVDSLQKVADNNDTSTNMEVQ